LIALFAAQRELREAGLLRAYHDRSDGGLFVTLAEMAVAAHVGLEVVLPASATDAVGYLFAEELGVVVQVRDADLPAVQRVLKAHALEHAVVARVAAHDDVIVRRAGAELFRSSRVDLQRQWSELTYRMQALRDDPVCAKEANES